MDESQAVETPQALAQRLIKEAFAELAALATDPPTKQDIKEEFRATQLPLHASAQEAAEF